MYNQVIIQLCKNVKSFMASWPSKYYINWHLHFYTTQLILPVLDLLQTENNTKNKYRVLLPYVRTDIGKHGFYFSSVLLWNNLADDLCRSVGSFIVIYKSLKWASLLETRVNLHMMHVQNLLACCLGVAVAMIILAGKKKHGNVPFEISSAVFLAVLRFFTHPGGGSGSRG